MHDPPVLFSRVNYLLVSCLAVALWVGTLSALPVGPAGALTGAPAAAAPVGDGGLFVPLQAQVFDSRQKAAGSTVTPPPLTGGQWRDISIGGVAGIPTTGVKAVALTFAVALPSAGGVLYATPKGVAPTTISFLNYTAGGTESNSGIVPLGTGGMISVRPSAGTHLVVNVQGYYTSGATAGGGYVPITPTRLVDTRDGTGLPSGMIQNGASPTVVTGSLSEVPADASALAVNFTITGQTAAGYITPFPTDAAVPTGGFNFPNVAADSVSGVVPLAQSGDDAGSFKVKLVGTNAHLIADVTGYFTAADRSGEGGGYTANLGGRIVDTRVSTPAVPPAQPGPAAPISAGATLEIPIAGVGGVPATGASAVTTTVAVVPGASGGYLTAWRSDDPEPVSSVLNFAASAVVSNTAIVALSAAGTIKVRNRSGAPVHIIVDVQGWYAADVDDGEVDDWPAADPVGTPAVVETADPAEQILDLPDGTVPVAAKTGTARINATWTAVGTSPVQIRQRASMSTASGSMVESPSADQAVKAGASVGATWTPVVPDVDSVPSEFLLTFGQAELSSGQTRASADAQTETATSTGIAARIAYGSMSSAFGGGWSERLMVTAYPECYAVTPNDAACSEGVVLPTVNNPTSQTLAFSAGPVDAVDTTGVPGQVTSCFPDMSENAESMWTANDTTPAPVGEAEESATDGLTEEGEIPAPPSDSTLPPDSAVDEDLDDNNDGVEDVESDSGTSPEQSATDPTADSPGPEAGWGITSNAAHCKGLVYSVTASAGGYADSLTATAVNPSGTWQVGEGSGEFTWSYPIDLPAGMADEAPELAMTYSSANVDGMSRAESGQASAAGLGWTMEPGYVSRSYASCAKDGHRTKGDQCWKTLNGRLVNELTVSVAGRTSRLVRDTESRKWRLADDPGWRVVYFNAEDGTDELGAVNGPVNDDNNNEAIEIASPDGTKYRFGWSANSVWTVPVFGNNAGEPCFNATPANASCQQAWRWNLDEVVSPDGNVVKYTYEAEQNHYKRWGNDRVAYDRAGRVASISYAFPRGNNAGAPARVRVQINSALRCTDLLRSAAGDCDTKDSAQNDTVANGPRERPKLWPDVPGDLICTASGKCPNVSPSFFTTYRYDSIESSVVSEGATLQVARYDLTYTMPDPDGLSGKDEPDLWLNQISRSGGGVSVPPVRFDGVALRNRVSVPAGARAFRKFRVHQIRNETGGRVQVAYGHADGRACDATTVDARAPHETDRECFAQQYAPPNATPKWVWFHKYLVKSLSIGDDTLGLPASLVPMRSLGSAQRIDYEYQGAPAWRFDASQNIPVKKRGWNDWRGYATTLIKTRNYEMNELQPGSVAIKRVTRYRGMSRSRTSPQGDFAQVVVKSVEHPDGIEDLNRLAGRVVEEVSLRGNGGWLNRTYHGYQSLRTAADPDGNYAHQVLENVTRTYSHGEGAGATRTRIIKRTFHDGSAGGGSARRSLRAGTLLETKETGSPYPQGGPVCRITSWAINDATWIRAPHASTLKSDSTCSTVVSKSTNYYDSFGTNPANLTDGIIRGNVTRVVTEAGPGPSDETITTQSTYDEYGRLTQSVDARAKATDIAYNANTGGLGVNDRLRSVTTTGPAATPSGTRPTTVLRLDPRRGQPIEQLDENNASTTMEYDGLGRLTKVRTPERQGSNYASVTYAYDINTSQPSKVTTSTRRGTKWDTSYAYLDGWGRTIETQTAGPEGGRLVSATGYDERGLPNLQVPLAYNQNAPGSQLLNANPAANPSYTITDYDALGRATRVATMNRGNVHSETRTDYQGNTVIQRPARGGRTVTTLDLWDRPTSVEQYDDNTAGSVAHAADYTYTAAGQLATIRSNIAGTDRTWRYTYDLAGRRTNAEDPDTGTTTYAYRNDQPGTDNYTAVTSPSGPTTGAPTLVTIRTDYDDRGRQTQISDGAGSTRTKLADWTYDTATTGSTENLKGRLVSTTSYTDLGDFTTKINGYDKNGNPRGLTSSVTSGPSVTESYTYTDDLPATTTYSAVGGLPATTVTNSYTTNAALDAITATSGTGQPTYYLADATYYKNGRPRGLQSAASNELNVTGATGRLHRTYKWEEATGRLTRMQGSNFGALEYTYDLVGNPTKIAATSGAQSAAWCYTYDSLNRLSTAKTGANDNTSCSTGTDADTITGGDQNLTYTYEDDRLTSVTSKAQEATGQKLTYNYANTTSPHATSTITGTGLTDTNLDPDLPKPSTLTYDHAGRITSHTTFPGAAGSATTTQTYNPVGTLRTTTYPCQTSTQTAKLTYSYGGDGIRTARRLENCGNPSTVYYLGATEVTVTGGPTPVTSARRNYTSTVGTPLAIQESNPAGANPTWSWLLADAQDTIRYTRSTNGTTTRPTYLPFGDPTSTTTPVGERGYLNKPTDPNGDVRLDHRNYAGSLNIFTAPDPLLVANDPQSLNPYAYARNNPLSLSDPSGLLVAADDAASGVEPHTPCTIPTVCSADLVTDSVTQNDSTYVPVAPEYTGEPDDLTTSWGDVVRETIQNLPQATKDVSGYTDLRTCASGPGLNPSCGWVIISIIPVGRIGRPLGNLADDAVRGLAHSGPAANAGTNALRSVDDVLAGLPKGNQSWVRMVPDEGALTTKFDELTVGGKPTTWKNFDGTVIERGDGVQVGMRTYSGSGGGAVDIRMPDGSRIRIHVEQP